MCVFSSLPPLSDRDMWVTNPCRRYPMEKNSAWKKSHQFVYCHKTVGAFQVYKYLWLKLCVCVCLQGVGAVCVSFWVHWVCVCVCHGGFIGCVCVCVCVCKVKVSTVGGRRRRMGVSARNSIRGQFSSVWLQFPLPPNSFPSPHPKRQGLPT